MTLRLAIAGSGVEESSSVSQRFSPAGVVTAEGTQRPDLELAAKHGLPRRRQDLQFWLGDTISVSRAQAVRTIELTHGKVICDDRSERVVCLA